MKIAIVGAGVGSLSLANLLAKDGHQVEIFEKHNWCGGKLRRIETPHGSYDTGPSMMTFKGVWDSYCERLAPDQQEIHDQISWIRETEVATYVWADEQVPLPIPTNHEWFPAWQRYCKAHDTLGSLINRMLLQDPNSWEAAKLATRMMMKYRGFDAKKALDRAPYLPPKLRDALDIQALNTGVCPQDAAPIFASVPAVLSSEGVYRPKAGMYQIVEVLVESAKSKGVSVHLEQPVSQVRDNQIVLAEKAYSFDKIVLGIDEARRSELRLEPEQSPNEKVSCSAIAIYGHFKRDISGPRHRIIMPEENQSLFESLELQSEPSSTMAFVVRGHQANQLAVLLTVPANGKPYDTKHPLVDRELKRIDKQISLSLTEDWNIDIQLTPEYFGSVGHPAGAIYGTIPRFWNAGPRHPRPFQDSRYPSLYRVGGSTHPGGGLPAVVAGAMLCHQKICAGT